MFSKSKFAIFCALLAAAEVGGTQVTAEANSQSQSKTDAPSTVGDRIPADSTDVKNLQLVKVEGWQDLFKRTHYPELDLALSIESGLDTQEAFKTLFESLIAENSTTESSNKETESDIQPAFSTQLPESSASQLPTFNPITNEYNQIILANLSTEQREKLKQDLKLAVVKSTANEEQGVETITTEGTGSRTNDQTGVQSTQGQINGVQNDNGLQIPVLSSGSAPSAVDLVAERSEHEKKLKEVEAANASRILKIGLGLGLGLPALGAILVTILYKTKVLTLNFTKL